MNVRLILNLGLFCGLAPAVMAAAPESPRRLEVYPPQVRLKGPEGSQRFVVLGHFADGTTRDLTTLAKIEPGKLGFVRIDDQNAIRPAANGRGEILVRVG